MFFVDRIMIKLLKDFFPENFLNIEPKELQLS